MIQGINVAEFRAQKTGMMQKNSTAQNIQNATNFVSFSNIRFRKSSKIVKGALL